MQSIIVPHAKLASGITTFCTDGWGKRHKGHMRGLKISGNPSVLAAAVLCKSVLMLLRDVQASLKREISQLNG